MPLEKELAVYEDMKADLLKNHDGKFVLIHGDEFGGTYDSAENAYAEGVKRFGQEPFLVKPVTSQEQIYRNQALALGLINAGILISIIGPKITATRSPAAVRSLPLKFQSRRP